MNIGVIFFNDFFLRNHKLYKKKKKKTCLFPTRDLACKSPKTADNENIIWLNKMLSGCTQSPVKMQHRLSVPNVQGWRGRGVVEKQQLEYYFGHLLNHFSPSPLLLL